MRDQRPFLHTESLRSFRFTAHDGAASLQFTLTHFLQGSGQRTGNGHSRSLVLCSVTHFVFVLRFVFGLLSGWKIQTWPIIRFLTGHVTYLIFIMWYLIRIHDAMCLEQDVQGLPAEK